MKTVAKKAILEYLLLKVATTATKTSMLIKRQNPLVLKTTSAARKFAKSVCGTLNLLLIEMIASYRIGFVQILLKTQNHAEMKQNKILMKFLPLFAAKKSQLIKTKMITETRNRLISLIMPRKTCDNLRSLLLLIKVI